MKGDSALALYWAQHEKTKRSIQGEWFSSGDRYRQDDQGNYWYEGRSDDMIPHEIVFVEELPKTVTGKIQRYKLREPGQVGKQGREHVS